MAATYLEFNTGGLFYGWGDEEVKTLDRQATENNIVALLRTVVGDQCTIVIHWEDGNDTLVGSWDSVTEEEDTRAELADLPWHDAERWAVYA